MSIIAYPYTWNLIIFMKIWQNNLGDQKILWLLLKFLWDGGFPPRPPTMNIIISSALSGAVIVFNIESHVHVTVIDHVSFMVTVDERREFSLVPFISYTWIKLSSVNHCWYSSDGVSELQARTEDGAISLPTLARSPSRVFSTLQLFQRHSQPSLGIAQSKFVFLIRFFQCVWWFIYRLQSSAYRLWTDAFQCQNSSSFTKIQQKQFCRSL